MREVLIVLLLMLLGVVFLYVCWCIAKMLHRLDEDNEINIDYDEDE